MSASVRLLVPVHGHGVPALRHCFAPFDKGGYAPQEVPLGDGGFALDPASKQKQIPLDPPFSKGETSAQRVHDHGVLALRRCFSPFDKGGCAPKEVLLRDGGFAFDPAATQEQIPLDPLFSKEETSTHCAPEVSVQVAR
jgi:hypothetical protein